MQREVKWVEMNVIKRGEVGGKECWGERQVDGGTYKLRGRWRGTERERN